MSAPTSNGPAAPAAVPTGLSVATVRAGLARGVGAAAPALRLWLGRTSPGDYRSPFPARLRAARAAVVGLSLVWTAVGFYGVNATRAIVQTVGHDTAPSVAAAEAIRTGLAAANADFTLALLSGALTSVSHAQGESSDSPLLSDMHRRLRAVNAALIEATRNITFGEEEAGPIATILQGLGDYEYAIGRTDGTVNYMRDVFAFNADDILHWTVLPAAESLGRVNADHLTEDYRVYEAHRVAVWPVAAAVLLVFLFAAVQVDIARTARRIINPGLLLATLAVLAATALLVLRLLAAQAELRVAKVDAFDSLSALSPAGAVATDFDAAESLILLASNDPARRARYAAENALRARRLLGVPPSVAAETARNGYKTSGDMGYLGAEIENVTFPGEREAAADLIEAWGGVLRADAALAADLARGDQAAAFADRAAEGPGSARRAFAQFDPALAKVRAINQRAFDASVAAAEADDAPLGAVLVAAAVVAVACAWFGIGRRLDEYRY